MSPSTKQSAQLGLDVQGEVHVGKSLETGNVSSYSGPVGVSHVSHKETQAADSHRPAQDELALAGIADMRQRSGQLLS